MLEDDQTLAHYEVEEGEELRIEVKARGPSFKFDDLQNKITRKPNIDKMTELNKHTFIFDGVNLEGIC